MKNLFSIVNLIAIAISVTLFSCEKKENLTLKEPLQEEVEEINDAILELAADTANNVIQGTAAMGDAWKTWDDAFFSCFQNETFKKNKIYLGPSNLRYLGTILSKDKNTTRRELAAILPPEEFNNFASKGAPVNTCDLKQVKNLSLNVLLEAAFSGMDDSLRTAITKYDSIRITGGEWKVDHLRTDDFIDYLNASDDSKVKAYRKSMLERKNLVITQVVKISGFSADIHSTNSFSAGLLSRLQKGEDINLAPNATSPDMSLNVNISKTNKKVVSISSNSEFYIFGMVMRGTKL